MHEGVETLFLPLRWTQEVMGVPYERCMSSKYEYYGMDYRDWKEEAMWKRDLGNEAMVFGSMTGVWGNDWSGFTLVNKFFGSNSQLQANINPPPNDKYGYLWIESILGASLFDWASAIEASGEIHTVSTSLLYILELLDLKQPIHLYPRIPLETDFKNVDYLFTKPYILH